MSTPLSSVNGLSSGIQWQQMVDQIMQLESQRTLTPVTTRQTALQAQSAAWRNFQTNVAKFRDAAKSLRDASSFDAFTGTATKSPTSQRDLVTVSAGTGAVPGSYAVEVVGLAKAEKLSGSVVADGSSALGISGSFALGGAAITVQASDSLSTLRDRINAANSGTNPSGVSATMLSTGTGVRLMLTSTSTGSSGVEMLDDGNGTLAALGLTDGTMVANRNATGSAQSNRLNSSTAAIATLLGIQLPTPSTIKVDGQTISVDFSVDSLATVATKINNATGNPTSAIVKSEQVNGKTAYRLVTDATIETDPSAAGSADILAAMGFMKPGRAGIAQVLTSVGSYTDATSGSAASGSTLLSDLKLNGTSMALATGDQIAIGGSRGDGTTVARTFTVGATSTVDDLLAAINDGTTGYGAAGRSAAASFVGGKLTMTDGTAGDSRLSLSLNVTHVAGGTTTFGAISTAGGSVGRSRQVVAGADAEMLIDGQYVTRSSNAITDAVAGVTLNLTAAEAGTVVNVNIGRDVDAIAKKLQDFASAYNDVRSFINQTTSLGTNATGKVTGTRGSLAGNSTVISMGAQLTSQLLNTIKGTTGSFTTAATAGLQHDSKGVLSLNEKTFKEKLATNFDEVKRLFTASGTPTDANVSFISAGTKAQASATGSPYAISISSLASSASTVGSSWSSYSTTGAPDTMTIRDIGSGITGSISLANGDSIDTTVSRLNSLFGAQRMKLAATKTASGELQITGSEQGSSSGFRVSYTPGAGGDGTSMLGIAAGDYTGTDVQGTINGVAATGRGQYLTGAKGNAVEGLTIRYAGTSLGSVGTIALSLGVGGQLASVADGIAATGTGAAATQADSADVQSATLDKRISDIQSRLDARRASLTAQFVKMESAMAQAQSMGNALSAQIAGLQSSSK